MNKRYFLGVLLMMFAVTILAGCTGKPRGTGKGTNTDTNTNTAKAGEHNHGATGPHGGLIIEFGDRHAEFEVKHDKQQVNVYILGEDAKTAEPILVEKLSLSIKSPAFEIDLTPMPQAGETGGKASLFTAKHPNFGKEQEFEGDLIEKRAGKDPRRFSFKEEPEKK
jgi:hypothetical protein